MSLDRLETEEAGRWNPDVMPGLVPAISIGKALSLKHAGSPAMCR
ncbi:hypothetical protein HPT29_016785 [Microvirga terrae]|uniref:Uncharacterized protein n=1 Tax=Microvirga terrae TaxID=2740529 RepID=A0ABY5RLR3_9HYPH|nr:hypothetical protein [Microvirga terrae]UVF18161.1 hypothetical protein HPT29_016785 [Microvirga terrae]